MDTYALLERLLLALSIGLLIGVERGWQERDGKEGSRAAGVRTFALIGLLGGLCALLGASVGNSFLAIALFAFAVCLAVFEWLEARASSSSSATGMIAGLVAFVLGAYAVLGDMVVAGASGIATTIILAERKVLHSFVERLKWSELRAALLLLVMTFVLLPLLPNHPVDPWQALNPRQLWLMMVIIAALSYVGYICVRVAGDRAGLIYAAGAGGLVSSTAVTLAYSRLAKLHPGSAMALTAGVTTAWSISLIRMSAIAMVIAPGLAFHLGALLGVPALILAGVTLIFYRRSGPPGQKSPLVLSDPFELSEVLKFGLLLTVVTLISKLSGSSTNQLGMVPLAAVSGLVDVDPVTLSAARMAGSAIALPFAATVIAVAAGANLACKVAIAGAIGSRRFAGYVLGSAFAAVSSAAIVWVLLR
jgi:uncharacterized membrane protein (DUF4010 family)